MWSCVGKLQDASPVDLSKMTHSTWQEVSLLFSCHQHMHSPGWARGNLACWTTRYLLTHGRGRCQSKLAAMSCRKFCFKKEPQGDEVGAMHQQVWVFNFVKYVELYDLLEGSEVKIWSCLRRILDCYQVGCWHKRTDDIHTLPSEHVCSVTQPKFNLRVLQFDSPSTYS